MAFKTDYVREASQAHTDLNVFAAVIVLLENSLNTARTYRSAQAIIKIAKREQQRCLRRYDEARAKADRRERGKK